jgi:uncharacterized protein (DUF362 family)
MGINRRKFIKQAGAGAAILAGGPAILSNGNVFAANEPRFKDKSNVSFVGSSESGTRRKMIKDVLEPWSASVKTGIEGKTVLIKVNMVYWNSFMQDPKLSLTHVDAVRGVIDFIRSLSASVTIIVGDCTCTPAAPGDITKMFTDAGYDALKTEYSGVTLKDLNTTQSMDRHIWDATLEESAVTTIPIIEAFVNPTYYVISLCRPKTHNCMVMTGVNKNVLMGAPLKNLANGDTTINPKQMMHGKNGFTSGQNINEIKCLSYNLYQLANVIYRKGSPALSVLDAWEGMEGEGPASGTSIMQYCAVAGDDPLAVDRIGAKLMGFSDTATEPSNITAPSYTDMRTLVWMSNAGLGNYDLSKINFILGSITDVQKYVKSYKLHSNYTGENKDTISYGTSWTGGAPSKVLTAIRESRHLDPRPFLHPQISNGLAGHRVTINFSLPVNFQVKLSIYNLHGAEICKLGDSMLPAGSYSMEWDGRDSRGSKVAAGNYIIKLLCGSKVISDRVQIGR